MKSPFTTLLVIAGLAAMAFYLPPQPDDPDPFSLPLASVAIPDVPAEAWPETIVRQRRPKLEPVPMVQLVESPAFLGAAGPLPRVQPLPLDTAPLDTAPLDTTPLDTATEPEPQPYRRDQVDVSGWTGALVYVSNPRAAAEGKPQPECVYCETLAAKLNDLAERSRWRVGLSATDHFRYVAAPSDKDRPFTVFYRDGAEVGRIKGSPDTGTLLRLHPGANTSAERVAWTSSPDRGAAVVESPIVRTMAYYESPMATGCMGASAAYMPPLYAAPQQATGCMGASSAYGGYGPTGTAYALPQARRRVQASPAYCGPEGCYYGAQSQSGLFGGSTMQSYSLIGLNLGVGF